MNSFDFQSVRANSYTIIRIQMNSSDEHIVRDFTEVGSEQILESHARVERLLEEEP